MKAQRYNTATRIRYNCASIFGVPESDLLKPEIRREKFQKEIGWVAETRAYSTVDVPILHKDWQGEYSLSSVFLNPKLMGVNSLVHIIGMPIVDILLRSLSPSSVGPKLESILWLESCFTPKPKQWPIFMTYAIRHLELSLLQAYWYVIATSVNVPESMTFRFRLAGLFRVMIPSKRLDQALVYAISVTSRII